jgi:hypothetical protein
MRGKSLAVVGSFLAGSSVAASAVSTGAAGATTIRIGTPGAGAGGGGGAVPDTLTSCSITVSGTSVTLWAETIIPFLREKTSVSRPLIVNFWPSGTVNCWFSPFSSVRITLLGGETCHTLPVTVSTVVTTLGLVVFTFCFSSFMPTFALLMCAGLPSSMNVLLSATSSNSRSEPSSNLTIMLFPFT